MHDEARERALAARSRRLDKANRLPVWKVTPEWKGETAFIIAGGSSVREQPVHLLEGRKVIAVNASYTIAPFAQVCFFGDRRFGDQHREGLTAFAGRTVTTRRNFPPFNERTFCLMQAAATLGLSDDTASLAFGRTSLQASINLAVHLGSPRIALLGADMCAVGGVTHHHAPHPWPVRDGCWQEQMEHLKRVVRPLEKKGIEVVNCSPVSLLPWWPKVDFLEVLSDAPFNIA